MKRKTAAWLGAGLFGGLMLSIAGVLYAQLNNLLFPGLALVGGMFVLCMGLLWLSEKEDTAEAEEGSLAKKRQRARS
ncbi:hypothetical protein WMW72_18020 [Paenibacillus filicis]|uniref:Uncharacterized protein n=1 Tax=Paenibacillus filicis TaxID=669464 RepID=A0ABU9DLS4_9BACL